MKTAIRYGVIALALGAMGTTATAEPRCFAGTGSCYDYINYDQNGQEHKFTWEEARADAGMRSYDGRRGHLATLTSQQEEQFLIDNWLGDILYGQPWLGGFRPEGSDPQDGWQWITGEAFVYENWNEETNEPNNAGDERFLGYISFNVASTTQYDWYGWNDRDNGGFVTGYFIEYPASVAAPAVPALLFSGMLGAFAVSRRRSRK